MTEELEQLLKNLKLRRLLNVYDEQLQAAEKAQTSYTEFVAGLLRAQWHERQESALEWRIHRANLPERWSLETFPWSRQPGVNRKQMRTFAELDFVAKHENLVLVGPTGVGKTGLACGQLPAEGFAEWPPLPVPSGAGPVRRNVCLIGGPIHAPVAESAGAPGRPSDRRIWVFKSQARAVEHVLQADGGALSSPLDDHNDEPWL